MNKKRFCKIRNLSPLLLLICLLVSTQAFAQNVRVTIEMPDATMEQIIDSIEGQTNFP